MFYCALQTTADTKRQVLWVFFPSLACSQHRAYSCFVDSCNSDRHSRSQCNAIPLWLCHNSSRERANVRCKVANLTSLSIALEQLKRWKTGWSSELRPEEIVEIVLFALPGRKAQTAVSQESCTSCAWSQAILQGQPCRGHQGTEQGKDQSSQTSLDIAAAWGKHVGRGTTSFRSHSRVFPAHCDAAKLKEKENTHEDAMEKPASAFPVACCTTG